jgi:RNA polymerase sigma-70 factor (ECF subfamily)
MNHDPDALIPTRRSLLTRLKNWDDQEGWRQFFDTYWRLIHSVAIRAGLTEEEAQDVVQETVLSVAKTMPQFRYEPEKCSFMTWLQHLTRKRIVDQYRKRGVAQSGCALPTDDTAGTATVEQVPDPASLDLGTVWEEEWRRNLMDAALDRVKTKVDPKQYQMFYLYAVKGAPVSEVARALRVNVARVYLAKHRIAALLKQTVRALEEEVK